MSRIQIGDLRCSISRFWAQRTHTAHWFNFSPHGFSSCHILLTNIRQWDCSVMFASVPHSALHLYILLSSCFPFIILSLFFSLSHSFGLCYRYSNLGWILNSFHLLLVSLWYLLGRYGSICPDFLIEFRLMSVKLCRVTHSLFRSFGIRPLYCDCDNVNALISLSYILSGHAARRLLF